MKVSVEGKKIVVYDIIGPYARENAVFDKNIIKENWYHYSSLYFYKKCLEKGIQFVTPDAYFALPEPRPQAICVRERDDTDMTVSLALRKSGVKLAVIRSSENPLYACRFYWNLPRLTSHFDHSIVMRGVKAWVAPASKFQPQYTPHPYYARIRAVSADFHKNKFITLIQGNIRTHWMRRLYVDVMNFVRPMPNFVNREGYRDRMEAIKYFSQYPDFDLYGRKWDRPVRYTHKYDEAIKKSWRGAPDDKFAILQQYKFSLVFENSYLGGYVQYINDSLYAGSVPIYWGAPDIAEMYPENCFIDFRKFGCDFARLNDYLRNMDESEYNEYIKNINAWISSPAAYERSQEKYVSDMIKLFESYF
ncbi:MAG: glycosyltransferase family 10 [Patescibacteria group bacterium]